MLLACIESKNQQDFEVPKEIDETKHFDYHPNKRPPTEHHNNSQ